METPFEFVRFHAIPSYRGLTVLQKNYYFDIYTKIRHWFHKQVIVQLNKWISYRYNCAWQNLFWHGIIAADLCSDWECCTNGWQQNSTKSSQTTTNIDITGDNLILTRFCTRSKSQTTFRSSDGKFVWKLLSLYSQFCFKI